MADGVPNGCLVFTFDGADYGFDFKAASRPAGYQLAVHLPDEVVAADAASTQAIVNVFAGSGESVVEMRVGDEAPWLPLEPVMVTDPAFESIEALEADQSDALGTKLPEAAKANHIWAAPLPDRLTAGTHTLRVQTTDMLGQTYTAHRIFRAR